ncbi:MAG: VOC family protein [Desulfobacterales bacterium]
MNYNPVGWFEIYVRNMQRAKKFYESVFRTTLTRLNTPAPDIEMWSFPMTDVAPGCAGALAKMEGLDAGGLGTMVYFSCQDCSVEASRAEAAGGVVHRSKLPIGEYGFIALVKDTEGNMIGLHSRD